MDRLFETALKGNVEELHRLLSENPLVLHQVGLTCDENPLHCVSTSGHLDYAKEMLRLKPKFAEELNPEGYSPAHLASANGHIEIVREMIKVNPMLFCRKGRDGKTALHFAVSSGRVDVIQEVLANCGDSMEVVTVQGETALHLAVKNYQVDCFRVMLDWVRQTNKEHIVNMKDDHGNTILHLAVWKKQRQVLESLFENGPGILEVNATNNCGLTALDLLSIFTSEAGDREIHEILQSVGASKAQNGLNRVNHPTPTSNLLAPTDEHDFIRHFKFHKGRDSPSDVRSTLLVIAVLVATATYQLGLNPPGDVWQDDGQGHMAGTSILGTYNLVIYDLLIAFNTIGFCVSLYMIDKLTSKFPLQTELQMCLLALYLTYNMAVPAISPPKAKVFVNVFTTALPIVVPVLCSLLRKYRVVSRVMGMFRKCSSPKICTQV